VIHKNLKWQSFRSFKRIYLTSREGQLRRFRQISFIALKIAEDPTLLKEDKLTESRRTNLNSQSLKDSSSEGKNRIPDFFSKKKRYLIQR